VSTDRRARVRALARELETIALSHSGRCTYSLIDLVSDERLGLDEDAVMAPASLIKVPILVALYAAVERGELRLDDRVRYQERHRSLGSGVLARMSFGVDMSVRDAATLMIIISDNSATNMCVDLLGLDAINSELDGMGLRYTRVYRRWGELTGDPDPRSMNTTTARETTSLLAQIARHACVSREASEDMLRILRRQDYRHELSADLPWNELNMLGDDPKVAWVAEKGGASLGGVRAGGSIFKGPNGYFAMSALCEGGASATTGRHHEANITLGKLGMAAWKALAA